MLAATAAVRSEDPYRQVGTALMRSDGTIAALGYNGAPPGVDTVDWADRDGRRAWVIHAEANALRYVRPGEVELLASTSLPCGACMVQVAAYGIHQVVYRDLLDPAIYDHETILGIAAECGISLVRRET